MICVTKEQAMEIRKKLGNEHLTTCNKHAPSKKKSYYVAESYPVMRLLQEMKNRQKVVHYE